MIFEILVYSKIWWCSHSELKANGFKNFQIEVTFPASFENVSEISEATFELHFEMVSGIFEAFFHHTLVLWSGFRNCQGTFPEISEAFHPAFRQL